MGRAPGDRGRPGGRPRRGRDPRRPAFGCLAIHSRRHSEAVLLNNAAQRHPRPELIAQRAFVLAALGRNDESNADLATLGRDHPAFAYMTRSIFRVRLVQALRRSDTAAAAQLARERTPELPLSGRDETLADLVLALSGGRPIEGENERLSAELAEDVELSAWIDFMAPGARQKLAALRR